MNNWIGPTVKQLLNYAMHVLNNFWGANINTTAFCLGQYSLHLLLLKSSILWDYGILIVKIVPCFSFFQSSFDILRGLNPYLMFKLEKSLLNNQSYKENFPRKGIMSTNWFWALWLVAKIQTANQSTQTSVAQIYVGNFLHWVGPLAVWPDG